MKPLFFIASMFFICQTSAQTTESNTITPNKMSFFAELGGPGILFSANLDSRFTKSKRGIGGRIGLGFVNNDNGYPDYRTQSVITIPIQVNYILGKPNSVNALEVGAGVTIAGKKLDIFNYYDTKGTSIFGVASFMYRRIPKDGGFSWRLGFTPIISGGYIQPLGGVSIGYDF